MLNNFLQKILKKNKLKIGVQIWQEVILEEKLNKTEISVSRSCFRKQKYLEPKNFNQN